MSSPSLSDQEMHPDESVGSAQQYQPLAPQNVQGSAMLDADIEAEGTTHPKGDPISDPVATNFSGRTEVGDPKTAGVASEMGPFSTHASATEKGSVNLHNNPDLPREYSDSQQGLLPDTDPNTNLPD